MTMGADKEAVWYSHFYSEIRCHIRITDYSFDRRVTHQVYRQIEDVGPKIGKSERSKKIHLIDAGLDGG